MTQNISDAQHYSIIECRYAEYCYAGCHILFIPLLNVIMLNVFIMNIVAQSVSMMNIVMLSVEAQCCL
jgi:hypothetical protein